MLSSSSSEFFSPGEIDSFARRPKFHAPLYLICTLPPSIPLFFLPCRSVKRFFAQILVFLSRICVFLLFLVERRFETRTRAAGRFYGNNSDRLSMWNLRNQAIEFRDLVVCCRCQQSGLPASDNSCSFSQGSLSRRHTFFRGEGWNWMRLLYPSIQSRKRFYFFGEKTFQALYYPHLRGGRSEERWCSANHIDVPCFLRRL